VLLQFHSSQSLTAVLVCSCRNYVCRWMEEFGPELWSWQRLVSDGCLKWNATCTALWKVTCFMVVVLRHHLMHVFGQAAGVFWTACTGRQLHYGLVECLIFHVCYIWIFNCWKNTVCRRNLPWVWNLRPGSLHVTCNYAIRYIMYDFL